VDTLATGKWPAGRLDKICIQVDQFEVAAGIWDWFDRQNTLRCWTVRQLWCPI